MSPNISLLHYTLIKNIVESGCLPDNQILAKTLDVSEDELVAALCELQKEHGVVLHPNDSKVWVIHPFSLAPTPFLVTSKSTSWWGNCAWCSLGVAALVQEDVIISTTIGAESKQVQIHIVNGTIQDKNFLIHFPIPMKKAWDNVIYTCSTMLLFESRSQIEDWCQRRKIPMGDIQPIDHVWKFAKKWYGSHLDPNWTKWTAEEAKDIFAEFDLTHPVWDLNVSEDRF